MSAPDHSMRSQRGMSIIELMVGIVIAMLRDIAATTSAMLFTSQQRQGIGASSATMAAVNTLSALKEDASQAGLGFFGDTIYLCSALNLKINGTDASVPAFSPLKVTTTAGVDQIDIFFADEVAGGANVLLKTDSDLTQAAVDSYLPADVGNAVLLSPAAVGTCTVRSVTSWSVSTPTDPQNFVFGTVGTGSTYNQGGAFAGPTVYPAKSRLSLLGNVRWHRYRVVNGNLQYELPIETGTPAAVLVSNVVGLRTRIGVVTPGGDKSISSWVTSASATPSGKKWGDMPAADLPFARAMEVAIVTRSDQPEKKDKDGNCIATPGDVYIFPDEKLTLSAYNGIDAACYRYRRSSVIVPLRNWTMGLK